MFFFTITKQLHLLQSNQILTIAEGVVWLWNTGWWQASDKHFMRILWKGMTNGIFIILSLRSEELLLSWTELLLRTKLGGSNEDEGVSVGIVITSDKHAVVFNYQVFTLLPHTSISWTPKNLTHTADPTLLTRVNRALICAWCSCLVIGEDLYPHPFAPPASPVCRS